MLLTGSTTDEVQEVTDQHSTPDDGVHLYGSIKNTDSSNQMTIRFDLKDIFGQIDSIDFVINPGASKFFTLLDPMGVNTTPPYTDYLISAFSTLPGHSATWEYHHTQF